MLRAPHHGSGAVVHAELAIEHFGILLDGPMRDAEFAGDELVGQPAHKEHEHSVFAWTEGHGRRVNGRGQMNRR